MRNGDPLRGGAATLIDTDVLIAGGGPVGLALAIELGRRGIAAILVVRSSRSRPAAARLPAERALRHEPRRLHARENPIGVRLRFPHSSSTTSACRNSYQAAFTLVRPDQNVAWRSNVLPADPDVILDTVRGVRSF